MTAFLAWYVASASVGGVLAIASAFKLVEMRSFEEWIGKLLRMRLGWTTRWIAGGGVAAEMIVGASLLVRPVETTLEAAWAFSLLLCSMQLAAKLRRVGSCACFGASSGQQGAMLGPLLAPIMLVAVSALLKLRMESIAVLNVFEAALIAGVALVCSMTALMVIAAPATLERLRNSA